VILALLSSGHQASNVIEDALLCVSALIEGFSLIVLCQESSRCAVVEMNIVGYLDHLYPILLAGLENHKEFQVRKPMQTKGSYCCRFAVQLSVWLET
jgi:hypothetical protein